MNTYNVSDYQIFTNGINTTNSLKEKAQTAQTNIKEAEQKINDPAIFLGPIQENCSAECKNVDTKVETLINNLNVLAKYLSDASANYQAGDQQASTTVTDVTDANKDKTETTTKTTGVTNTRMSIPTDPTIAAKKQEWLGDVDDPSRYTEYQGKVGLFNRHNTLELFDNTTGEVIQDHGKITLKPGETRVITVKLPTDTGMIQQITRTTADGDAAYRSGRIVTARSDIDPNPDNIEYVRIAEGKNGSYHAPSNTDLLHNNSYDWIITANANGTVNASQTCLWSSTMTNGRNLKAMINLKVEVTN